MEAETSSFETSEMLGRFLASTPLLSESWKLCGRSNFMAPHGFLTDEVGGVVYVAFSGVQPVDGLDSFWGNLVPLVGADGGMFSALQRQGEENAAMVDAGLLHLFLGIFHTPVFQNQMFEILKKRKPVIFTGHSIGGAIASISSLWLLSYLQSISSPPLVLCITFGSPLVGNGSLSRAILQERWAGNFCHVVAKFDIVPRLLFAPLAPITAHLHSLFRSWHLTMGSPLFLFGDLAAEPPELQKSELFRFVLRYVEGVEGSADASPFSPFGNYVFCSGDGAVCVDDPVAVVRMLHLTFASGSPNSSVKDHLSYEDCVSKICLQYLNPTEEDVDESDSYEAGVTLALRSSGISSHHDPMVGPAKDCLKMAKHMGRTPNLNSASLAIGLSKITPLRAQIEWYKAACEESDDQMGYYDSFKLRGASKRDFKVFMNRIKLGEFWDNVIRMLESNQLPDDFPKRAKWVNASQFYKLLVEPLDIAEYYRTETHRVKGHYVSHGRERRYEVFDRWWRERTATALAAEHERSKFASATQDSCFWAKLEEARELLEKVRSEREPRAAAWEGVDGFDRYAKGLIEKKEVSRDVLAKNSSYTMWVEEVTVLKRQLQQFPTSIPDVLDRKVVP